MATSPAKHSKARGVLIAGNWKMNLGTAAEVTAFFDGLPKLPLDSSPSAPSGLRVCLFPPALSLAESVAAAKARKLGAIEFGAQNAHWEPKGAFTGELSAPMIRGAGAGWALIGHSERRSYFSENDRDVGRRARGVLSQGVSAMVCLGETRIQRENDQTASVISEQLKGALAPLVEGETAISDALRAGKLVIAYEPVWAIGTGLTATPEQAEEAHRIVRAELTRHFGAETASLAQILYGGSVTPENIASLLACENIDGALVGGASMKPESFGALVIAGRTALP